MKIINECEPYVQTVRVNNEWVDDYYRQLVQGRNTGFTGGYSSDVNLIYSSCMPGIASGGFTLLPPTTGTGATVIQIASSSAQDSDVTGTGIATMLLFYMTTDYEVRSAIVSLKGTTPQTIPISNVYHFMYGFPLIGSPGTKPPGQVTANVGALWVGSGTFSTANGFTTNYMWNRAGDGFVSSGVYVTPKGKYAQLLSLKYNSDTTVSCQFQVYGRSSRLEPWSLNAEDVVNTTTVIQRSFTGGYLPPGFEVTVLVRKTVNTANIAANFVLTMNELSSYLL